MKIKYQKPDFYGPESLRGLACLFLMAIAVMGMAIGVLRLIEAGAEDGTVAQAGEVEQL